MGEHNMPSSLFIKAYDVKTACKRNGEGLEDRAAPNLTWDS